MKSIRALALPALLLSGQVGFLACGGDDPSAAAPADTTADGGGVTAESSDGCANSGTGQLTFTVKGLPDGAKGKVSVEGPGGKQEVDAPGSISLAGGSYSITAGLATKADAVVRSVFTSSSKSTACVKEGAPASVELSYDPIASSGRLWMLTGDRVSGFASPNLAITGTQKVESLTAVSKPTGVAFESDGSVWIAAGTSLRHYPASVFGKMGDQIPDVTLDVPAAPATDLVPAISGLAFDRSGNLWYSACAEGKIRRIAAADLRASGAVTKYLTLGGLQGPGAPAFDAAGNLWVAGDIDSGIHRYSAARLTTSQDGPDMTVVAHSQVGGDPELNKLLEPAGIAFDAAGNLWALYSYGGGLVRLTPADLATTNPTPALQIPHGSGAHLGDRIAFDESGGLWFSYGGGSMVAPLASPTFARFSPDQLKPTEELEVVPERIITVDPGEFDITRQLAFFPAPAGLPIYGSVP